MRIHYTTDADVSGFVNYCPSFADASHPELYKLIAAAIARKMGYAGFHDRSQKLALGTWLKTGGLSVARRVSYQVSAADLESLKILNATLPDCPTN